MSHIFTRTLLAGLAVSAGLIPLAASADVLLMERVQKESRADLPSRGMAMSQVESRFGPPSSKLDPRGGDAPTHPVINRWEYDNFVVYFERDRVISSVVKRADRNELGPKQVR